jgi:hypothetical protein
VASASLLPVMHLASIMRGLTSAGHSISEPSLQALAAVPLAGNCRQLHVTSDTHWKQLVWGFAMQVRACMYACLLNCVTSQANERCNSAFKMQHPITLALSKLSWIMSHVLQGYANRVFWQQLCEAVVPRMQQGWDVNRVASVVRNMVMMGVRSEALMATSMRLLRDGVKGGNPLAASHAVSVMAALSPPLTVLCVEALVKRHLES